MNSKEEKSTHHGYSGTLFPNNTHTHQGKKQENHHEHVQPDSGQQANHHSHVGNHSHHHLTPTPNHHKHEEEIHKITQQQFW